MSQFKEPDVLDMLGAISNAANGPKLNYEPISSFLILTKQHFHAVLFSIS